MNIKAREEFRTKYRQDMSKEDKLRLINESIREYIQGVKLYPLLVDLRGLNNCALELKRLTEQLYPNAIRILYKKLSSLRDCTNSSMVGPKYFRHLRLVEGTRSLNRQPYYDVVEVGDD